MPKLFGVSVLGSGKPETPWSRMQAENLSNIAIVLEELVVDVGVLEEPHAASASVQQIAAQTTLK
jgi:hypothetical protein